MMELTHQHRRKERRIVRWREPLIDTHDNPIIEHHDESSSSTTTSDHEMVTDNDDDEMMVPTAEAGAGSSIIVPKTTPQQRREEEEDAQVLAIRQRDDFLHLLVSSSRTFNKRITNWGHASVLARYASSDSAPCGISEATPDTRTLSKRCGKASRTL